MTTASSSSFAENLARLGAPLLVILVITHMQGIPVGAGGTIAAAALSAFLCTVFDHFCSGSLLRAIETRPGTSAAWLSLGGVNALLGGVALALVHAAGGF